MIAQVSTQSLLLFAVFYPLFPLLNYRAPFARSFYQFNLGMCGIFAGVGSFLLYWGGYPALVCTVSVGWLFILLAVTAFYWNRDLVNKWIISAPSLVGGSVIFLAERDANFSVGQILSQALGAFVLSAAVFTTTFGHWYLNVRALSPKFLNRAILILFIFLFIRLLWNLLSATTGTVLYLGDTLPLWRFLGMADGFFLWIAFFFGTFFPIILVVFAKKTLDDASTTSATGILYVALISVLMGDLSYKFFNFKYGLYL